MMSFSLQELQKLEAEFGNPLYIFDEMSFLQNYHDLETALRVYYSKYQLSYSFKTNYTPYICSIVKRLGGFAEIVSGMEYDIAQKLGFENDRIIYNGPNKGESGINALLNGAIVNIDNLDELSAVCRRVKMYPQKVFEIGLRANIDVGQNFISRFGMDDEDLKRAFDIVSGISNLRIVGLHCHISRCRGRDAWQRRTEKMLKLADLRISEP